MDLPTKMLTAADLQRLGFSRCRAYAILQAEDIKTIRIGRRLYLDPDELTRWLNAHVVQGDSEDNDSDEPANGRTM